MCSYLSIYNWKSPLLSPVGVERRNRIVSQERLNPPHAPNKPTGGECFPDRAEYTARTYHQGLGIPFFLRRLRDGRGAIWQATAVGCLLEEPTGGRHLPGRAAVTGRFFFTPLLRHFPQLPRMRRLNFCTNYCFHLPAIHGAEVRRS